MDAETSIPGQPELTPEHQWLQFWQKPWQRMDPSWIHSDQEANLLASGHANPALLRARFNLNNDPPIRVEQPQADFVFLERNHQQQLVYMAAEVIRNQIADEWLSPDIQVWCSRLTKALSPKNWAISHIETDNAYRLGLMAVRYWFPNTLWPRVRLLFEKDSVLAIERWGEVTAPQKKMNVLWQSILWRDSHSP